MGAPFWTPAPTPPAYSDQGYTRSKSALYTQILFSGQPVGLAQNVRWEGQTGNGPMRGIGEPYMENKPGDFFFTGSMGKFSVRGMDMIDVAQKVWPTALQVDFRILPFELDLDYVFQSASAGNANNGNGQGYIAQTTRRLVGLYIQTWGGDIGDPNALEGESLTFWASGMVYMTNGMVTATIGNIPSSVWPTIGNPPQLPSGATH